MKSLRISGIFLLVLLCLGLAGRVLFLMIPDAISTRMQQSDPPVLRPIFDEDEVSAGTPLVQVLEIQFRTARYPMEAFQNVLRSRLRHRQFQDLEDDDEWSRTLASVTDRQGTDEAHAAFHMAFVEEFHAAYEYGEDTPKIRKYWPWIKQGYHARDRLYKGESWIR
jgi:hypothetical protein